MEYSVNKETLGICKPVFDGCLEQSVDLDFNLPEYCPDIQKILKCQVYPRISARNIVGDRLNVEGIAIVNLIYLDSEKLTIRCCEHSSPFSVTFNLKTSCENCIVFTKTKVEYINCRAITQRRVDIHGAFSVCAKVKKRDSQEIVCGINDGTIEQKKEKCSVSNLVSMAQQQFSVNETIELSNLPPIEAIVKSEVKVLLNDYRTITNKLILNAEAIFNLLYISNIETGEIRSAQFNIPVSQIVDAEGIEDNCDCDINIEVLNHDMQQKLDGNGENSLLGLDIKMVVAVMAYEPKEIEVLNDIYSTEFEVEKVLENLNLSKLYDEIQILHTENANIDVNSSEIIDILDAWGEVVSIEGAIKDNAIVFNGKINVCVLALTSGQEATYFERMVEFEHKHDWKDSARHVEVCPSATIVSLEARNVSGRGIDVAIGIKISAPVYVNSQIKAVSDIIINEEKPLEKDTSAALTVYYASAGENLWDIARKYCTSVESIRLENELEADQIEEHRMILIPM